MNVIELLDEEMDFTSYSHGKEYSVHMHEYKINRKGNGKTTSIFKYPKDKEHIHHIRQWDVLPGDTGHTHTVIKGKKPWDKQ